MANKLLYGFLITPDTLIQALVLDNKIVGKYTAAYLDNTESSILAGKPDNTRCTGADSVSGHTAVSACGCGVLSSKVSLLKRHKAGWMISIRIPNVPEEEGEKVLRTRRSN